MKSFDCLDSSTEILGSHLLEASAGTGKTFAIEHLFVRFLLEVDISKILVVTFTKKATAELKSRIFENIENAILVLEKEKETNFDYLLSMSKINGVKEKLKDALFSFDEAQIYTIHGFCQRMLTEHFLEAKTYINSNADLQSIKNQIREVFTDKISSIGINPFQLKLLLKKYESVDKLIDKFLQKYPEKHLFKTDSFSEALESFNKKLAKIPPPKSPLADLANSFSSFKKTGFKNTETFVLQLEMLDQVLALKNCTDKCFVYFLETGFSVVKFLSEENLKKNKEEKIPEALSLIRETLLQDVERAKDPNFLFSFVYDSFYDAIKEIVEREGFLSPDIILEMMAKKSKEPLFVQSVQNRFDVLVIDEFQDTDPIQWSIFENLFLKEKKLKSLYLVGDPKQSIYRFRKADLYTYLKAQRVIGSDNLFHLSSNFRSEESLVDSLNAFFSSSFAKKWLALPKEDSHLPYIPVEAKASHQAIADDLAPLHFFIGEEKGKRSFPSKEMEEKTLYPFIYKEIKRLKLEGYQDNDFAVLVKDRYQALRIQGYLESHGLKCILHSQTDLRDTQAFQAIKDLLEFFIFYPSQSMMKKVLLGPFFNFAFESLVDFETSTHYLDILSEFSKLYEIFHLDGIGPFFDAFLSFTITEKVTVIDRLCEKDPAFFHETLRVFELLLSRYHQKPSEDLCLFFDDIEKLSIEEEELLINQSSDSEDGVEIITIHKSKGLEYTIVFALGLVNRTNPDKSLSEDELLELDAEKLRQLYVALTRAKNRVYVPFVLDQSNTVCSTGGSSSIELFFHSITEASKKLDRTSFLNILKQLDNKVSYSLLEDEYIPGNKSLCPISYSYQNAKLSVSSQKVYSFTSLLQLSAKAHGGIEGGVTPPPQEIIPPGPETGVVLHSLIEKAVVNPDVLRGIPSYVQGKVQGSFLEEYQNNIVALVEDVFNVPLFEQFGLKDIDLKTLQVETDVLFPIVHEDKIVDYFKGIIDLAFYHEGKYYLVDWKSNYLENGYDKSEIHKQVVSHEYDLQASIYFESFKRFLQRVEKVDVNQAFGGYYLIFLRGLNEGKGIYKLENNQLKTEEEIYAILSSRK